MQNRWLISNINFNTELKRYYFTDSFAFFVENESIVSRCKNRYDIIILIDGYILPGYDHFEKYNSYA